MSFARHDFLKNFFLLFSIVADRRSSSVNLVDKFRRLRERIDRHGQAGLRQAVRNDAPDELLFEFRDVEKFRADSVVFEFVQDFADERQKVSVRQLDLKPENLAGRGRVVPLDQTAADADLMHQNFLFLAKLRVANCRQIEGKSDMLSLIY